MLHRNCFLQYVFPQKGFFLQSLFISCYFFLPVTSYHNFLYFRVITSLIFSKTISEKYFLYENLLVFPFRELTVLNILSSIVFPHQIIPWNKWYTLTYTSVRNYAGIYERCMNNGIKEGDVVIETNGNLMQWLISFPKRSAKQNF